MLSVYSPKHSLRNARTEIYGGEIVEPFECPARAEIIINHIKASALGDIIKPTAYGLEPVKRVHDEGYLDFLQNCWQQWQARGFKGEAIATCWPTRRMTSLKVPEEIDGKIGYYALAGETSISDGTWQASLVSKDVALTATNSVLNGNQSAFALCRPPGHHAAFDQFGGYCFLNNAAISAQYAIDQGCKRVAILDVDFHHGNGTQDIFYERDDVFFLSIHGDPIYAFPYFLGHADETGRGKGEGFTKNYPLMPGADYSIWQAALVDALKKIKDYRADLLIVSLGVDTFENDPISFFKLNSLDFTHYGVMLGKLGIPTVFVMEGGYAVEEIGINTVNVLQGFSQS